MFFVVVFFKGGGKYCRVFKDNYKINVLGWFWWVWLLVFVKIYVCMLLFICLGFFKYIYCIYYSLYIFNKYGIGFIINEILVL